MANIDFDPKAELPTHFADGSERRSWRLYASAALSGLLAGGRGGLDLVTTAAGIADVLLEEERARSAMHIGKVGMGR